MKNDIIKWNSGLFTHSNEFSSVLYSTFIEYVQFVTSQKGKNLPSSSHFCHPISTLNFRRKIVRIACESTPKHSLFPFSTFCYATLVLVLFLITTVSSSKGSTILSVKIWTWRFVRCIQWVHTAYLWAFSLNMLFFRSLCVYLCDTDFFCVKFFCMWMLTFWRAFAINFQLHCMAVYTFAKAVHFSSISL